MKKEIKKKREKPKILEGLYYTDTHEWAKVIDGTVIIGITDYAQGELGDIVLVELPKIGASFRAGAELGCVESVKAVSELYSPIGGEVVEVNKKLESQPELVNSDPYGEGWMVKIRMSNLEELKKLLSPPDYEKLVTELEEE